MDTAELDLMELFNPGAAMKLVASGLNSFRKVLTNGFLILMTVIFMLIEASSLPLKLRTIFGDTEDALINFEKFINNVKQYMVIKTLISLATGILIAIWLAVIGVDFPLLWGLLAFLLNYVPSIGSIIAAIPAVLLTIIQLGPAHAVAVAAGFLFVNVVMGNFIEPRFMGQRLGLSTLVVFLSLIFWGWVLGPVGMLLSVPLTMTAKIALDSREETRWLSIILGPEIAPKRASKPSK
jgi:predicted PurR-regulated permease PerM